MGAEGGLNGSRETRKFVSLRMTEIVGTKYRYRPESKTEGATNMVTTMQPTTGETTKQLVNYRTDGGVAVVEMCDPPANTYTYEMNRQLDEAILRARMGNDAYVILLTGDRDKLF